MRWAAWAVSAGRPDNVPALEAMAGMALSWAVPAGEESAYIDAGAEAVLGVPGALPNICGTRNAVMDMQWGLDPEAAVVMLDDDTRAFRLVGWHEGTRARTAKVGLSVVVEHVLAQMEAHPGMRLGGIAPTANWLYVCGGPTVKTRAFIQSQLVVVKPTHLRYDPDLELSEDYDYWLQHAEEYGGAVRDDLVLIDAVKRTNAGGLQGLDDRASADCASRRRLAAKWPLNVVWPHPRKGEREVLVRFPDARQGVLL